MKKIILAIEKNEKSFSDFKKEKIKFQKVFLSKLWNFSKKNSKVVDIALDFRNIKEFEIPEYKDLKEVKYIFINKESKKLPEFVEKNKKLVYSFSSENEGWELINLFKKDKNTSEKDFKKFLKSVFLEISVEKKDEEYLFKKIVFIRKSLIKILEKESAIFVNILIKNNFTLEENQEILENKLLKIDGVIIE